MSLLCRNCCQRRHCHCRCYRFYSTPTPTPMLRTFTLMVTVMATMTAAMMFPLKPPPSSGTFVLPRASRSAHTAYDMPVFYLSKIHFECHQRATLKEKFTKCMYICIAYTNRVTTHSTQHTEYGNRYHVISVYK